VLRDKLGALLLEKPEELKNLRLGRPERLLSQKAKELKNLQLDIPEEPKPEKAGRLKAEKVEQLLSQKAKELKNLRADKRTKFQENRPKNRYLAQVANHQL
jgi:hypothetical protein